MDKLTISSREVRNALVSKKVSFRNTGIVFIAFGSLMLLTSASLYTFAVAFEGGRDFGTHLWVRSTLVGGVILSLALIFTGTGLRQFRPWGSGLRDLLELPHHAHHSDRLHPRRPVLRHSHRRAGATSVYTWLPADHPRNPWNASTPQAPRPSSHRGHRLSNPRYRDLRCSVALTNAITHLRPFTSTSELLHSLLTEGVASF